MVSQDLRGDQALRCGGKDVVVVHLAPFIAARRALQVTRLPIIDALAAIPIIALDAAAIIPAAMLAIVMATIAVALSLR